MLALIWRRLARAGLAIGLLMLSVLAIRRDALADKKADDMQDAYNRERTRDEVDRDTAGPGARGRLHEGWRRD